MSQITLNVFRENGDAEEIAEYHNNHRGAPIIWQALAEWYGIVPVTRPTPTYVIFREEKINSLWALAEDPKVKPEHRVVLRMTFDLAVIAPGDLITVADALRETALDIQHGYPQRRSIFADFGDPGHLPEWERTLRTIANLSDGLRGVGWHMCSATGDPWQVQVSEDEWRVYNLDQDNRHHFIDVSTPTSEVAGGTRTGRLSDSCIELVEKRPTSGLTPGGSCVERCIQCKHGYQPLRQGLCPDCREE